MKFTTFIPTRRNDGSLISQTEHQEILRDISKRFGGVTIEGTVDGHWVDENDGEYHRDENLKVTVACQSERLYEAEQLIRDIGRRLNQKTMYFEVREYDGVRFLRIGD